MRIRITWPVGQLCAELNDTVTARKIWDILPCESIAKTWGEEVYFEMSVQADLEDNARQVVDPGSVCFWTGGGCLALPFGPTPVSEGAECRLVTEVNVLGIIEGDPRELATVTDGVTISVERIDSGSG